MNQGFARPSVVGLFHVAIKTSDLEATKAFWCDLLGLLEIPRPDFGYDGAWLACAQPGGNAIIHIYAGGPAVGDDGFVPSGTSAIDHISLSCSGYSAFVARFAEHDLPFREFLVPGTMYWQLFVYDPSGVQVELTFEGKAEGPVGPDMSPGRGYEAGTNFFGKSVYPILVKSSRGAT